MLANQNTSRPQVRGLLKALSACISISNSVYELYRIFASVVDSLVYNGQMVNGISIIQISKFPARSEWKAIYFPSADHVG